MSTEESPISRFEDSASDCLAGQIIAAPLTKRAYAILCVYPAGTDSDISPCDSLDDAVSKSAHWDAKYPRVNHHIVAIDVPAYKPK